MLRPQRRYNSGMAIRSLLGLIFVCTATSLLAAQHTTFRFSIGLDEVDTVEFDESRVSADDVKHWMKFTENGYYSSAGISVSGCDENAKARMLKDLQHARQVKAELNQEVGYPFDLSPVVNYLKQLLRFNIWLGQQYITFAETRSAPASAYDETNFPECRVIAERIAHEPDAQQQCEQLGNAWTQCILKSEYRRMGPYPKASWKAFLDANGIRESVSSTTNE